MQIWDVKVNHILTCPGIETKAGKMGEVGGIEFTTSDILPP